MAKEFSGHPCVNISSGAATLEIFDHFYADSSLPKTEYIEDWNAKFHKVNAIYSSSHQFRDKDVNKHNTAEDLKNDPNVPEAKKRLNPSLFARVNDGKETLAYLEDLDKMIKQYRERNWLVKIKDKICKRDKDIDKLFNSFKQDILKYALRNVDLAGASLFYDKQIFKAKMMGQHYLVEVFQKNKSIVMDEMYLVKNGFNVFIKESDIIQFLENSDRGIRIDFLSHYTGMIPDDVVEKKINADKLFVFDNYCVMYYSDGVPVFRATTHEKEVARKAKDPILFGMIRDSRRLYYIADWVSENDDLTLNKFYDVTGISSEERTIAWEKDVQHVVEELTSNSTLNQFAYLDHNHD